MALGRRVDPLFAAGGGLAVAPATEAVTAQSVPLVEMQNAPLLPTAILKLLSHSLRIGGVDYPISLLSDARRMAALQEGTVTALRQLAIRRIWRNARYLATLRTMRIGASVLLNTDVDPALSHNAHMALRTFLGNAPLTALAEMTWGEIFGKRREIGSRLELLAALAELEAALDNRPTAESPNGHDAQFREYLSILLDDPRIDRIRPNDLRFGWKHLDPAPSLRALLEAWAGLDLRPTRAQSALVEKLVRAMRRSIGEDILDIAQTLASITYVKTRARVRAAEVFAARHGARDYGPDLDSIGKRQGLSASWVSQVEAILLRGVGQSSLASPAAIALLERIDQMSYLSDDDLNIALELSSGNGHSLGTFRRFCLSVLRPSAAFDLGTHVAARAERRGVASTYHEAGLFQGAMRVAQRVCRVAGAAHLNEIAGAIALESGRPVDREELVTAVEAFPHMRWLDREHGWFSVDDFADSLVYVRVRKILAVAKKGVWVREIAEALYGDAHYAEESGGEFGLAPLRILKAAVLGWPDGIIEDARGRLLLERSVDPAYILSPREHKIYLALASAGGIATSRTVMRAVEGEVESVLAAMTSAPFIKAHAHGLYALRGWPIGAKELLAALAERVTESKARGRERSGVHVIRMN